MVERKTGKTCEKARLQNWVRPKTGRYYARADADGKEIWKSLKTSSFSVAEANRHEELGDSPGADDRRCPDLVLWNASRKGRGAGCRKYATSFCDDMYRVGRGYPDRLSMAGTQRRRGPFEKLTSNSARIDINDGKFE